MTWWHDDMMTWWHDDMMTWCHDDMVKIFAPQQAHVLRLKIVIFRRIAPPKFKYMTWWHDDMLKIFVSLHAHFPTLKIVIFGRIAPQNFWPFLVHAEAVRPCRAVYIRTGVSDNGRKAPIVRNSRTTVARYHHTFLCAAKTALQIEIAHPTLPFLCIFWD